MQVRLQLVIPSASYWGSRKKEHAIIRERVCNYW